MSRRNITMTDAVASLSVLLSWTTDVAGKAFRVTVPLEGLSLDNRDTDAVLGLFHDLRFYGPARVTLLANDAAPAGGNRGQNAAVVEPRLDPRYTLQFEIAFPAVVAAADEQILTAWGVLHATEMPPVTNWPTVTDTPGMHLSVSTLAGDPLDCTIQEIDSITGAVEYQGTWNANTNSPDLPASSPLKGWYYVVDTVGTTALGGITSWGVGDWAIYNGTTWGKVSNSERLQDDSTLNAQDPTDGAAVKTLRQVLTNIAARLGNALKIQNRPISATPPTNGQVLLYDEPNHTWKPGTVSGGSGGGATEFTDLSDVPNTYSGQRGRRLRVKNDESGLKFVRPAPLRPGTTTPGVRVRYYNGTTFLNFLTEKTEAAIDFYADYGNSSAPRNSDPLWARAFWSAHGECYFMPAYSETYTFEVQLDDELQLYIDGDLEYNKTGSSPVTQTFDYQMQGGRIYKLEFDYTNGPYGAAKLILKWQSASQAQQIVPTFVVDAEFNGDIAFTSLTDTPTSYVGNGGNRLRVNDAANALKFVQAPPLRPGDTVTGFLATYFSDTTFTTFDQQVVETTWDIFEQNGTSTTNPRFHRANFSMRAEGYFTAAYSETYTFKIIADDSATAYVDGDVCTTVAGQFTMPLVAGRTYKIVVDYVNTNFAFAQLKVTWRSTSLTEETLPTVTPPLPVSLTKATTLEAQAGTEDTRYMTPAKTAAVITALTPGIADGSISTAKLADDAVTFGKLQNIGNGKLLGRGTAGTGDVEEITLGTNLSLTGTTLNATGGSSLTLATTTEAQTGTDDAKYMSPLKVAQAISSQAGTTGNNLIYWANFI